MVAIREKQKQSSSTILYLFITLCFLCSWNFMAMAVESKRRIPVNVGVVVNVDAPREKIYLSCIKMGLSDFYASHPDFKTRLDLHIRNSNGTVVGAAAAALDLIRNTKVQAILGPSTSMQASFVVSLGDQARVPIISFSATSPSLTSFHSSFFFQFAQNDLTQVQAITSIVQNFGWRQVVTIYADNTYGEGIIPFLIDALQEIEAHVPYRCPISQSATDDQIEKELYKLMTMQTRVFIVHMTPKLCSRLFTKVKEIGMMSEGYVWIVTNGVGNHLSSMGSVLHSMQGVLGVETNVPRTLKLRDFVMRWRKQFQRDNPTNKIVELDAFAFQAYDAAFALAIAIEKVGGNSSFKVQKMNASYFDSTNLDTLEASQYGMKISDALTVTSFNGIAGDFNLVDRQLQQSTFKIVNVHGDEVRAIGYWKPENGTMKQLKSRNTSISTSASKYNIGPIVWPGDSPSVPRGWEIPTKGKKLRIGVPLLFAFTEFVKISKDPSTNRTDVTGFCIDVFKAAVEMLPYALPYEFIPYTKPDGTSAGNNNDLVYQIFLKKLDAVVGEITIRANRSLYVDFTMPYTESNLVMVVPIVDTRSKNAWVFLKPLTWDLWVTTLCFFIFIGFVIWLLEHRINEDFRGPPSHQIGTSFWFSFSTMVFSQRERVVSNLARFVMIIWVFVVLIVTQSYTANLASLLTVQQLQPSVTDIKELLRNGDSVGYSKSSFAYQILRQIGFDDSRLKVYASKEEFHEALSKGSKNGGISAIVNETPYLKLFVAKYCSKYTMIGPIFKTGGLGFAFPKGSPLVPDMSQAILNLTEGDKIMKLEDKWMKGNNCQDSSITKTYSNSLGLESFWGLFLIAGLASIFSVIISLSSFLHKNKHVFNHPDSGGSKWKKIRVMFEIFNEKEISSHTSKSTTQQRDNSVGAADEVKASSNNDWIESPYSYANDTEANSVFCGEQPTPSDNEASPDQIVPAF